MKVYYEEQPHLGDQLLKDIIDLKAKYETLAGKIPNRIVLTQKEYDILKDYFRIYLGFPECEEYSTCIFGMEIGIKG